MSATSDTYTHQVAMSATSDTYKGAAEVTIACSCGGFMLLNFQDQHLMLLQDTYSTQAVHLWQHPVEVSFLKMF
jgi:hypothetical protein